MAAKLAGKVAVVTGGGGLGRHVACLLAAEGAAVVVNDLGTSTDGIGSGAGPADQVVDEIRRAGGTAIPNYDSVASFQGAKDMVEAARKNFGRLDILIHVAGILRGNFVFDMTEEQWDGVVGVHLGGAFNMVRHAVPLMIRQRAGRIVLFASGAGVEGRVQFSNYSAAKEAMVGMARTLAVELRPYNITVNAFYPFGYARTVDYVRKQYGMRSTDPVAGFFDEEAADPKNNAAKVVYLCTEEGGAVTGKVIGKGQPFVLYSARHVTHTISKPGRWTLDELDKVAPRYLVAGLTNPAPPSS